jgi:superfamily II DNA/RNA helicase
MVRRLKEDLRGIGLPGLPERHIVQIDIPAAGESPLPEDAPDLLLARLLDEYGELRQEKLGEATKSTKAAARLIITSLQKRLLSSIEAFACTLRVHRRAVDRVREKGPTAVRPAVNLELFAETGLEEDDVELTEEEESENEAAALELASEVAAVDLAHREQELLEEMTRTAEAARGRPDPRLLHLLGWIRKNCLVRSTWNERRVLIFTEYADTKRYLEEQLRAALATTEQADARIDVFHGGMGDERREEIKRAFNASPSDHTLRILIATDAAREGVNLQNHCADLFHFDVPWNPSRMEQRNGRIDRKLQRAEEVRCHYYVFTQRPEDQVLKILVEKTKTIQAELGSLAPVLEARLAKLLQGGFRRRDLGRLEREIRDESIDPEKKAAATEELDAAARVRRDQLSKQIDELRDLMKTACDAINFDTDSFRDALSAGFRILGTGPLEPEKDGATWRLPQDARLFADPTWNETLDTLRAPRRRGERLWDWRKTSPIRPVVFRDVGSLDDQKVHLHLEHRLVQRILGRFLAQGFVRDDLARAVAIVSDDPIPRVILLGRLSIFGDRGSRLHDEILAVAARWNDPKTRKEALEPYKEKGLATTLSLVEAALKKPREIEELTRRVLIEGADRDFRELEPVLNGLAKSEGTRAEAELKKRGERESRDMLEILESQRKRIAQELERTESKKDKDTGQLFLPGFSDDEKRQVQAEVKHWLKRLEEIAVEVEHEPKRVREAYVTRVRRVEPVGLVYLWPVTG